MNNLAGLCGTALNLSRLPKPLGSTTRGRLATSAGLLSLLAGGVVLVAPFDDLEGQVDAAGRDQVAVFVVFSWPDEFGASDFDFSHRSLLSLLFPSVFTESDVHPPFQQMKGQHYGA